VFSTSFCFFPGAILNVFLALDSFETSSTIRRVFFLETGVQFSLPLATLSMAPSFHRLSPSFPFLFDEVVQSPFLPVLSHVAPSTTHWLFGFGALFLERVYLAFSLTLFVPPFLKTPVRQLCNFVF